MDSNVIYLLICIRCFKGVPPTQIQLSIIKKENMKEKYLYRDIIEKTTIILIDDYFHKVHFIEPTDHSSERQ